MKANNPFLFILLGFIFGALLMGAYYNQKISAAQSLGSQYKQQLEDMSKENKLLRDEIGLWEMYGSKPTNSPSVPQSGGTNCFPVNVGTSNFYMSCQ